jgi:hypothetical protein
MRASRELCVYFCEGRGLVHVRGESTGSNNNCLYQTMFYVSTRKERCFESGISTRRAKINVAFIALLLAKIGTAY